MKLKLYVSVLSFIYCSSIYAQTPIVITDSVVTVNIGENAAVFLDKTGPIVRNVLMNKS